MGANTRRVVLPAACAGGESLHRAEQRSGPRRPSAPLAAAELRDAQITLIFTVAGLSEFDCDTVPIRRISPAT